MTVAVVDSQALKQAEHIKPPEPERIELETERVDLETEPIKPETEHIKPETDHIKPPERDPPLVPHRSPEAPAAAPPLARASGAKQPPPRPQPQPHLTKLTLPAKYQHYSLITRLWLQSRVPLPDEKPRGTAAKAAVAAALASSTSDGPDAPVTSAHDGLVLRAGGRRRPLSLATVWLWLDIARALTPYLGVALRHVHPVRLAIYLFKMLIDALQPTAKLYAQSQLYDLCEEALEGKPAPWLKAVRLGSTGLIFRIADELMSSFFSKNADKLHSWVEYALEKTYLTMRLDLPLHCTDEVEAAQIFEAGVFAGIEAGEGYNDGPWGLINGIGGAFAKGVDTVAKVSMIVNALGGIEQLKNIRDGAKGTHTAILLALAFAPTILQHLREKAYNMVFHSQARYNDVDGDAEMLLDGVTNVAIDGRFKQEVVLFGLRDWLLAKWDKARARYREQMLEEPDTGRWISPLFGCADDALRTLFYVLLATKTIDTGLTLGSIHLYQSTASQLIWSVRSVMRNFDQAWQSIFFAAAFVGALDPVPKGLQIDYDTVRVPGGMRIEARNLSFTYRGAPEPTLRGVNLVVERGETLAIVGYNGGGKTTLVKVLMGLFGRDDGSELLFNDISADDFAMPSVHRRQSALFQDFAKYEFSLQENVAIGDVSRADDLEAINAAIEAGGAQAVRDKLGFDSILDPYGAPRAYKSTAVSWRDEVYDSDYNSDLDSESDSDDTDGDSGSGSGSGDEKRRDKCNGHVEGEKIDGDTEAAAGSYAAAIPNGDAASNGDAIPDGDGTPSGVATPSGAATPVGEAGAATTVAMGSASASNSDASTPEKTKKKKKRNVDSALSGGQWQRIGLARAFMRAGNADLVVFDEPSAALDPRAEADLFANIHGLSRAAGATTIYISHRFNTVRRADKIALMDGGRVAEYGSHAELMALKGQYYELFTTQAEGYLN